MIQCVLENGHQHHFRHITVDAIIIKDQHILLIQRSLDYHIEPGKYALPGGFLEFNETADQAVVRETREETGYQATNPKLFKIVHTPRTKGDDRQNVGFFYQLDITQKVSESDFEVHQVIWLPLEKLTSTDIAFDHLDHINHLLNSDSNDWPIIS